MCLLTFFSAAWPKNYYISFNCCYVLSTKFYFHHKFSFDPGSSPSAVLAGFRIAVVFDFSYQCRRHSNRSEGALVKRGGPLKFAKKN